MKDQASLNLLIVDSPIDNKALTGHLMLRATSTGLKVYDATGSESELGGGGEIDWSNISASTINISTTTGELKLMGASSMTLELPASNSKIHFEGASLNLFATDLNFNGSALNTAEGLVQLDESGRLPAVDGSQLTNLPAATVDLSNYSAANIKLTGTTKIELNAGTGTALQIATESGDAFRTTFKTSGLWSADIAGYLTAIHGGMQMDIYADSSQADVRIYAGGSPSSSSGDGNILLYGSDIKFNGNALNSANGLVKAEAGKLPALDGSKLTNLPGGSVDLSAYTGGINLNSTNDSAVTIKFNSGNPTYNAGLTMDAAGVTLSGYGDVTLQHTGGSYLRLTSGETTLSSNASLTLSAGSRLTISASEGIYLGGAGFNTAGGLVKVGDDGKISSSLYDAGATMATPPLMFTVPSNASGLHLEITAGKLADGTDNAALINTSNSADHRAKVLGNSGGTNWITCPDTGFGTNFAGWPVKVDVTGLLDPSEISYIRYRWVPTSGDPSDWYAMVYPCATEAPIPSSGGSGGDTTELENRVTTLESTVGSLDKAVDEILADYGEGSGALVYRVVASATEPTNPTEGMIWIQTE